MSSNSTLSISSINLLIEIYNKIQSLGRPIHKTELNEFFESQKIKEEDSKVYLSNWIETKLLISTQVKLESLSNLELFYSIPSTIISFIKGKYYKELNESISAEINQLDKTISKIELSEHIRRLHEYNELKDSAQHLLGKLGEIEGVITSTLYPKFGLNLDD